MPWTPLSVKRNDGQEKLCLDCQKFRPVSQFHADHKRKIGLRARCKECRQKESRKYYLINSDDIISRASRWKKQNPVRTAQVWQIWYRKNRHAVIKRTADWKCQNPKRRKVNDLAYKHRRKAHLALAEGTHTWTQWIERVVFCGWKCFYCAKQLSFSTLTQDHRIPLSRGGTNWPSNLVPACGSCNSRKLNRTETEFRLAQQCLA